jgi:hypothetical protein
MENPEMKKLTTTPGTSLAPLDEHDNHGLTLIENEVTNCASAMEMAERCKRQMQSSSY